MSLWNITGCRPKVCFTIWPPRSLCVCGARHPRPNQQSVKRREKESPLRTVVWVFPVCCHAQQYPLKFHYQNNSNYVIFMQSCGQYIIYCACILCKWDICLDEVKKAIIFLFQQSHVFSVTPCGIETDHILLKSTYSLPSDLIFLYSKIIFNHKPE